MASQEEQLIEREAAKARRRPVLVRERQTAEDNAAMSRASAFDDDIAEERGRLFAAHNLIQDPERRKQCEDLLGKAYCKMRWPEAYSQEFRSVVKHIPGFGNVPK